MSGILRPLRWFYHEFGVDAIQDTGRNAYLIILARSFRMIAHGANSLILGMYVSQTLGNSSDYLVSRVFESVQMKY